jgi:hypothetical protein
MKNKIFLSTLTLVVIIISATTNILSNTLMLLMERENHIPEESNIFTFSPYETNEGSSSYWIYGEDKNNYYHFTYKANESYWVISKKNACQNFNKSNFSTWCTAQVAGGQGGAN